MILAVLLLWGPGSNSDFALEPTKSDLAMPAEETDKWNILDFLDRACRIRAFPLSLQGLELGSVYGSYLMIEA